MPGDYPDRPVGLRIVAAIFGLIVGLWSLFVPKEGSLGQECNMVQEVTGSDACYLWTFGDWMPQVLALFIAGCCVAYAFLDE